MSFDEVATIDKGVLIRASGIPGAGNGLFTGRPFFKNDLITEYCGPIIDHQKALKLRKRGRATHVRVLNSQWLYIDGLKQPVQGQGGASFANDARQASAYNAVFVQRFDRKLGRDRVFLKASRNIDACEEVFVSYGNTYWQTSKQRPQLADQAQSPADNVQEQQQAEQQLRRSPRQRRQRQLAQRQESISFDLQQNGRQQQQQGAVAEQHSNSTQQVTTAPLEQQARVCLPCKRVVLQEMQQAEDELQRASKRQVRQQQQQPLQEMQQQHRQSKQQQVEVEEGSQESSNTQVGSRRSARVRCRQDKQQQNEQLPEEVAAGSGRSSADAAGTDAGVELSSSLRWGKRQKRSACKVSAADASKLSKHSSVNAHAVQQTGMSAAAGTLDASAASVAALAVGKFAVKALAILTRRGRS